jgi:hypothetical protein
MQMFHVVKLSLVRPRLTGTVCAVSLSLATFLLGFAVPRLGFALPTGCQAGDCGSRYHFFRDFTSLFSCHLNFPKFAKNGGIVACNLGPFQDLCFGRHLLNAKGTDSLDITVYPLTR